MIGTREQRSKPGCIRPTLVALAVMFIPLGSAAAWADDDRFIIQVDDANKGLVMALSKSNGGVLKQEGRGFFAAEFKGRSLSQVRGLLNNPHVKLVEEDVRRVPMALFNDTGGDPAATAILATVPQPRWR